MRLYFFSDRLLAISAAQRASRGVAVMTGVPRHWLSHALRGVNREFKVGGDEPCEPTVRLTLWSELVASYSRTKSAWGWANGGQPILVCYIRKYVIILGGDIPVEVPPNQNIGGMFPRHPRRGWRQCMRCLLLFYFIRLFYALGSVCVIWLYCFISLLISDPFLPFFLPLGNCKSFHVSHKLRSLQQI